ncbi:MAG: hypothetical protein JKY50_22360 [Oleispira sp.]|nr:hypothetical protein [Oleispira sp.]
MRNFKVWLKRFDPALNFVVAKSTLTVAGDKLSLGDPIDKTKLTPRQLRLMYDSRKIVPIVNENKINNPAEMVEATVIDLVPVIEKKKAGWLQVVVNGEKIGKATRDEEEASRIVKEYLHS